MNKQNLISLIISNTRAYSSTSLRIHKQGNIEFFYTWFTVYGDVSLAALDFMYCGHKNVFEWAPDYPVCILPVISAKT